MTNLPILYFTLGMLAGLPVGYRAAATWYEQIVPWLMRGVVAYTVILEFQAADEQTEKLMRELRKHGVPA